MKNLILICFMFLAVGLSAQSGYEKAMIAGLEQIQNAKTAQDMSCLLYTSPSPRDRTRSRMPSSA